MKKLMKPTVVRVSPRLCALWREAAAREELSRAAFLRLALQERARRVLSEKQSFDASEP